MEITVEEALSRGIEAHQAGQVEEADRFYTLVLNIEPRHPDANHNMGILAVNVGQLEQALPFFRTAIEVNPSIDQFWINYIDTLINVGQVGEAKAAIDRARQSGRVGQIFDQLDDRVLGGMEASNHQDPPQPFLQPLLKIGPYRWPNFPFLCVEY